MKTFNHRHTRLGGSTDETLWAVTSYFDPTGRKLRLPNYREFRRRLEVPLVAVELSFDGSFDLTPDDAEILIQVRGGSILWQKERLLNLALQALPSSCDIVAWIDCDGIFLRSDWPSAVRRQLDRAALVHLFERLHYVPENYKGDLADLGELQASYRSIGWCFETGTLNLENFATTGSSRLYRYVPGMAWAAKRSTIQAYGFYDGFVLGGGDKALFAAACGRSVEFSEAYGAGLRAREHYLAWAERFYDATRGQISYIEGDIFHLWHGELTHRGYITRHSQFAPFAFDPYVDIALTKDGVWHWSSNKPEMHDFVRDYFENVENQRVHSVAPRSVFPSLRAQGI
jgi:hypothetical protein